MRRAGRSASSSGISAAVRRAVFAIPIALGVSVVCFFLAYLAPGDPLQTVLPTHATAETITAVKHAYGFDRPIPVRLARAYGFDPNRAAAATFQALPRASFVVNCAAQASDSALTTASAELKWTNGWSAAATFEAGFSNVTRSCAGKGVVGYAW